MDTYNERQYLDVLRHVRENGEVRSDRTGVGTLGGFGYQMDFNLRDGRFPLLTTKRVHTRSVIHELLWMLQGSTNNNALSDVGVTIWDEWADPKTGDLGPIYGKQWRRWDLGDGSSHDQVAGVLHSLATEPFSRRHIVSAWNVADLHKMALPPCHLLFQFWVSEETRELSCQLYQRSADLFLGVPFNIASYSLLTAMFADSLGYRRGRFIWTGGDVHIYRNHLEQVDLQLSREPRPGPTLQRINNHNPLRVKYDDVRITGYDPHPSIPAPVAR